MAILSPFGFLYGKIAVARNSLYERGILRSFPLGAKTVSIGNITTGGTGKTPLVALVAETLATHGEKVCILTRGYGRRNASSRILVSDGRSVLADATNGGDEPVELAQKLVGRAVVVADADRVSAARWGRKEFGITAFVLDDGFQHRRAKRDLDIVCIDATDPFGGGEMLPAGRLREPLKNLRRADAIVITRADLARDVDGLHDRLARYIDAAKIFTASTRLAGVKPLADHGRGKAAVSSLNHAHALAFCGLGNPRAFFDLLRHTDLAVEETITFADHHYYSQDDVRTIESAAKRSGADSLLTTAKDAVKLVSLKFKLPCFVVEIETVVSDGFRELISEFHKSQSS